MMSRQPSFGRTLFSDHLKTVWFRLIGRATCKMQGHPVYTGQMVLTKSVNAGYRDVENIFLNIPYYLKLIIFTNTVFPIPE